MKGEPTHRKDNEGKYRLKTGNTLVNGSFDLKRDAEAWGSWNNFGGENPYEIVLNEENQPT